MFTFRTVSCSSDEREDKPNRYAVDPPREVAYLRKGVAKEDGKEKGWGILMCLHPRRRVLLHEITAMHERCSFIPFMVCSGI